MCKKTGCPVRHAGQPAELYTQAGWVSTELSAASASCFDLLEKEKRKREKRK